MIERLEQLYSDGKISMHKYAERLIREGRLPPTLNPWSKKAVEELMKYREKHAPRDSATCFDVYGEDLQSSLIEAQAFFNRIRPLIIDKPIKRIVSQLPEYKEEYNDILFTDYKKIKENITETVMAMGAEILLEIGEHYLEFKLWAPNRFELKLNPPLSKNWIDATGKTIAEINKAYNVDISCLYQTVLIGKAIKDIKFIADEEDVEKFVFILSNGNELHLYESIDEPIVELHVTNKYGKMWIQGKISMQQLAKELIEKGIIPAELDYKSHEAVQLAIKYQKEEQEKNREKTQETIRIITEKRKNLPSINAPENYDKTYQELAEMGYLHEEIMWEEDIDMFK